jgi:hypothetical protein
MSADGGAAIVVTIVIFLFIALVALLLTMYMDEEI